MIEQVQCSNPTCGSYKVRVSSRSFEDPQTHKHLSEFRGIGCLGGFLVWFIGWYLIFPPILQGSGETVGALAAFGGFGCIIVGLIVVQIIRKLRLASLKASAVSVYHLYCDSCSKQWEERRYPDIALNS